MVEEKELLQVKYDLLFHDLFNENEMNTLEWIVMKILNCKHEDIHGKVLVKNIRKPRVLYNEKTNYVDLIVNFIGALVFSVFGYFNIKNRNKYKFVDISPR